MQFLLYIVLFGLCLSYEFISAKKIYDDKC